VIDVDLGSEPSAARELHLRYVDMNLPALPKAIESIVAAIRRVRVPLLEPRPFRSSHESHELDLIEAISASAVQESDVRVQVGADLHDARVVVPVTRLVDAAHAVPQVVMASPWRVGLCAPPVD